MKLVAALLALLACTAPGSGQSEPADAAARSGGWRLADASSPYLRAHADNPVDWYPWGPEAFARAKELDRPIFLSIGYSACHWCHRMERDTFEDAESARLLNEQFVCIKVDREERPDIDSRYMQALQIITGGGGWPASLFLTSDGRAFAGGTYFPPDDTPEIPGLKPLLGRITELWTTQRAAVLEASRDLNDVLLRDPLAAAPPAAPVDVADAAATSAAPAAPGSPNLSALVNHGLLELSGSLDSVHGGTFGAPKFPPPLTISFLLGQHVRTGVDLVPLLRTTLDAMAGGALQDHVAGGFHRYCVDGEWKVPHFEKMLADNALLARTYAEAFAVTGEREYADIARRTLGFMLRDLMVRDTNLFASSLDADSLPFDASRHAVPGAHTDEGLVSLWTPAELNSALGDTDGPLFALLYDVTPEGNFGASRSILRPMRTRSAMAAATEAGAVADWPADAPRGEALLPWLDSCLARLEKVRASRPQPFRDDKCLAAPNGLALSALAVSAGLLQDRELRDAAVLQAAVLIPRLMHDGVATLRHQVVGTVASGEPDLLDHAAVGLGMLDAASVLGTSDLFEYAFGLANQLLDRFEDPAGGFWDTTGSDPHLPGRTRDVWDAATPSGTSLALQLLLRLAPLDDSGRFATAAQRAIARLAPLAEQQPAGFPALFSALEMARGPLLEIVIDGAGPDFDEMFAELGRTLLPAALVVPHTVLTQVMLQRVGVKDPSLLADRTAPRNAARTWICVNRACLLPVVDVAGLKTDLATAGKR